MTEKSIPVERGCGARESGGVYCELGTGPGGMPVEWFLMCPPQYVDVAKLGIKPRGVRLAEVNGAHHIFDWIGNEHYPNVADFVEEVKRFGLSRRLPETLDFSKLTPDSRIITLHSRAWLDNFGEYVYNKRTHKPVWVDANYNRCPKGPAASDGELHNLGDIPEMCSGVWWQDVSEGEPQDSGHPRLVRRVMPSFEYVAAKVPAGVRPRYAPTPYAFASFPISRLVVINDALGHTHEAKLEKAKKSKLTVESEDC